MTGTADGAARRIGGSFRDPGGFVFEADGRLYRQINRSLAKSFDAFIIAMLFPPVPAAQAAEFQ